MTLGVLSSMEGNSSPTVYVKDIAGDVTAVLLSELVLPTWAISAILSGKVAAFGGEIFGINREEVQRAW